MTEKPMTDTETVAKSIYRLAWGKSAHWPPHNRDTHMRFIDKADTAIKTLKSLGWKSPAEVITDDTLLFTIADIRAVTGVGTGPMLSELADAIKERMEAIRAETVEECAKWADFEAERMEFMKTKVNLTLEAHKAFDQGEFSAKSIAARIRSLKQVKE